MILIVTKSDDIHAHLVRREILSRSIDCAIVETDNLTGNGNISWTPDGSALVSTSDRAERRLQIGDIRVIWWRRAPARSNLSRDMDNMEVRDLVTRSCRAALTGLLLDAFNGRWLSHPDATSRAENKIYQLGLAKRVGLMIPRTIISQCPSDVRDFCDDLNYEVIVKTLASVPGVPLLTGRPTRDQLTDDAVSACPSIYQELIPGNIHIRVCSFGERHIAFRLQSDHLDWRYPLDASVEPIVLDPVLSSLLSDFLRLSDLEMGIFDLKVRPDGTPIWLEINPQGQFLFLEGLSPVGLVEAFADFVEAQMLTTR